MPTLDKQMMKKTMNKYKGIFSLKYRAFKILRNNIEEVVTQITLLWKDIYGLSTEATEKKVDEEKKDTEKGEQEAVDTKKEVQVKDGNMEGTEEIAVEEAIVEDGQ